MFSNFIKNIVKVKRCSEALLHKQKAKFESGVYDGPNSRQFEVPALLITPPPAPSYHLSDTDAPLPSIMDQEAAVCCGQMQSRFGRAALEDIPAELRCHILSFLSYNEIIRCALTSHTMYDTVKSSVELQYIIELGSQKLIQVHPRPPTVSTAECLHIIRDKANAWNSFELDATKAKALRFPGVFNSSSIIHQQLGLSNSSIDENAAYHAIDFKSYATRASRRWRHDHHPVIRTTRFMDDAQDLIITARFPTAIDSHEFKVLFHTISTGEEHPLAHESRVVAGKLACDEEGDLNVSVSVLGDRIALCVAEKDENGDSYWSLHVWNWHQGGQADDISVIGKGHDFCDVRFLTRERLLVLSSDVFHSAQNCARLKSPDDHWIWTTNPADRVISVMWSFPTSVFVISARIFLMNIPPTWFDATLKDGLSVPWSSWGPQNSRCFGGAGNFGVGGSRVIRVVPVAGRSDSSFQLHMTDFNSSAVARGIGKVTREPTTTTIVSDVEVTTCLPFVEVVYDQVFDASPWDIALNEERMVISTLAKTESIFTTNTEGIVFDM
ncbi:uncharacterized protein EDB91DRAFT_1334439 [Suillus paluster]|uniref:uncharacterized protein n=1 Tax=Suillus paluster TaxID=48578 RepID=UPI001B8872AC|nr:uncharacterized protein EDB91DRAFT_1334439 [Suillus paluster]KAG1749033.1 hypothetical protein EDB91DRAFT_1334439 [Suillus paluster]